jgi:hypothetical protein
MDNSVLTAVTLVLGVLALVVGLAAKLAARIVFGWHHAGSIGKGTRIWHD